MRSMKMVGLAVLSALAAMAFVGAGSASADALCETNPGHANSCPTPLASGTLIKGNTTGKNAFLLNASKEPTMTCRSSALGSLGASHGPHKGVLGLLTSLLFSECEGLCPKATGHSAPFLFEALVLQLLVHVRTHNATGLKPGALLEGCTFFKVNCLFQIQEDSALLTISGDTMTANNVPLVRSGHSGLCPASGFWDATYLMTLDTPDLKPIFFTSLP